MRAGGGGWGGWYPKDSDSDIWGLLEASWGGGLSEGSYKDSTERFTYLGFRIEGVGFMKELVGPTTPTQSVEPLAKLLLHPYSGIISVMAQIITSIVLRSI